MKGKTVKFKEMITGPVLEGTILDKIKRSSGSDRYIEYLIADNTEGSRLIYVVKPHLLVSLVS